MKTTLALAALLVAVLVGAYVINGRSTKSANTPTDTSSVAASTTEATSATSTSYTLSQVATHNTAQDCWTTISGGVYNLTAWITEHPGGEGPILSICGKDGTSAFLRQHSQNTRPQQILATFKVGILGA